MATSLPVVLRRTNSWSKATKQTFFEKPVEFQRGISRRRYWEQSTDFLEAAGSTLPAWLAKSDTSAAGSPTTDYVANTAGGIYRMAHDSQNEAQLLILYGGNHLTLNPVKSPWLLARIRLNTNASAFSADQRLVVGLASATNATLDTVATNAWFRLEGANNNILVEGDDGTTDTDDQDSTLDWTDNSFLSLAVDIDGVGLKAHFHVDLEGGAGWQYAGNVSIPLVTGSNLLQPYIHLQKDAGAETEVLDIDFLSIGSAR